MRREIARELGHLANGIYKIDQEAATADEKETDIRLRSTASPHEAVIEIKLGEKKRSARELRDTLKNQLVTKYMAAETSRSGCLVITLSKERHWDHPDNGSRIFFLNCSPFYAKRPPAVLSSLVAPLDCMFMVWTCGLGFRQRKQRLLAAKSLVHKKPRTLSGARLFFLNL